MTDSVSEPQEPNAATVATAAAHSPAAPSVEAHSDVADTPASDAAAVDRDAEGGRQRSRRGGRNQRGGRGRGEGAQPRGDRAATQDVDASASAARTPRAIPAVLHQLADWYPHLFGAVLQPLKLGIFQDLLAAHPDGAIDRDALKVGLAFHTRSTRYLTVVSSGQPRCNLQGEAVEAVAPEHVHHALLEVFRRRQQRSAEDLRPKLINRIIIAYNASGLTREDYAVLVQSRDEATNSLLDEALAEAEARNAKDEALLRAFEVSNQSEEGFADMYGMGLRQVAQTLQRSRNRRAVLAAAAERLAAAEATAENNESGTAD